MALRINTNVASLNAHKNMIETDRQTSQSLGRLSSGLRINKAADDASGMIIADSLKAQSLGVGQAIRNANDGISIVQTADGALKESINIVNTIKTKAIQAASDGQTAKTRTAIQNDIDKLMEELDVIAKTTSYNGQKLLSGSFTNKSIQIGAYANETADISIASTESTKTGHISTSTLQLQGDGGEVQLTITSALTGEDLKLNTIDIQSNNKAENGMGALADEINRYSASTGISATAVIESTTQAAIKEGTTGDDFAINGINIGSVKVSNNDSNASLVTAINAKTAEHGVKAAIQEDGKMTLTSTDGRAIKVTGGVDDVFSSTAAQMSTIGKIELTQNGTSEISVNGVGAGATGMSITTKSDLTTVEDSLLAAGSTIKAGSELATGTTIGGDAYVQKGVASSQTAYEMKTGSSLAYGSDIAKGTTIGAQITVGGDTSTAGAAQTLNTLEQDMLVTKGSTLKAGTIIGAGTVVTSAFQTAAGGTTHAVGETLSSAVTLGQDVTLQDDMTMKFTEGANNSKVAAGSTLSAGTVLGMKLDDVGITFDDNVAATSVSAGAATTQTLRANTDITLAQTAADATIKAGSLLAKDTELVFSGTYSGPTIETNQGTIEAGHVFAADTTVTLTSDQKLGSDMTVTGTSGSNTIKAGSILTSGLEISDGTNAADFKAVSTTDATLSQDMTLGIGSSVDTGSKLVAGSKLGDKTAVMGNKLGDASADVSTYQRTDLKSGSTLKTDSVLGQGSTIGGTLEVKNATDLKGDMSVKTGTVLANGSILKAGTVINQDMTFTGGTVKAGSKLSQDMTLNAEVTLTGDMTLKEGSQLADGTKLAVNTTNAGTVGLSETQSYKLSDINVLTQEGAQRAIQIADAALESLDNTRASLGSTQNQLTSSISNLSTTKTNIMASESAIRDVDFAEESMNYSKLQLLGQTGSYAMAQANASSQNIMSLLK